MNHISPALDREIAQLFGNKNPGTLRTDDISRADPPRTEQRMGVNGRPILSLKR